MPPLPFDKLLSADYLFNAEPGAPSIAYGIIGVLYLLLLVAGIVVYRYHDELAGDHHLKARLAKTAAIVGIVLGAIGVVLVGLRYLLVPILSARILIYLLVLVSLVLLGYFVYYALAVYPARLARFEADELRRRYLPRPRGRPSALPSRIVHPRKKGKKRR